MVEETVVSCLGREDGVERERPVSDFQLGGPRVN